MEDRAAALLALAEWAGADEIAGRLDVPRKTRPSHERGIRKTFMARLERNAGPQSVQATL